MAKTLYGFYVSFSGELSPPIDNVYALSPNGEIVSKAVLAGSGGYQELRGMAFGPDGNLYVAQAYKKASLILQFGGAPDKSGTRKLLGSFVTPAASSGLSHPYQLVFNADGDLFVTSQDTNVVTAFSPDGKPKANSKFLQKKYPTGKFNPGTFVAAFSAKPGAPAFTPVPAEAGGLTFKDDSLAAKAPPPKGAARGGAEKSGATHSARGLAFDKDGNLYVADEGANRVAVFDDGGKLIGEIKGSKSHELVAPVALCFVKKAGPSGTLYIGSPGNRSLFAYDVSKKDFQAKAFVWNAPELEKLSGVAVDPSGNILTGERKTNAIHKWTPNGEPSPFAGPFSDCPEQIIAVTTPIVG